MYIVLFEVYLNVSLFLRECNLVVSYIGIYALYYVYIFYIKIFFDVYKQYYLYNII